jgi:hypothetical protein
MSLPEAGIGEVVAEAVVAVEILARALHVKDARLEPTLEAIVAHAAAAHPAARDAGLILLARGQQEQRATAGPVPETLDRWQQKGRGPVRGDGALSGDRHYRRHPRRAAVAGVRRGGAGLRGAQYAVRAAVGRRAALRDADPVLGRACRVQPAGHPATGAVHRAGGAGAR